MEYRYAIMPIMFSIRDIMALNKSKGNAMSVRKHMSPEVIFPAPVGEELYIIDEGVKSLDISVMAKGLWASSNLRKMDQINLNPVTTAAAVYKLSFVVRWFINVNSFLDSHVKAHTTSSSFNACWSVRERSNITSSLKYVFDDTFTVPPVVYAHPFTGWNQDSRRFGNLVIGSALLREVEVNSYKRVCYKPSDVKLVWSPYLDWKRGLDALYLSSPFLNKRLRNLLK
jgi:hypothetical protein